jgi:PAS domain S-box-containing protein
MRSWLFDKWLIASLGILVAVLIFNGGVAYLNTQELHYDSYRVAHAHEALENLEELFSTMAAAETGARGFLITGDKRYLEPYNQSLAALEKDLEAVNRSVADNDRQQSRIPRLRELIRAKLDVIANQIALRNERGFEAARQETMSGVGLNTMGQIRSLLDDMKAEELALLEQRKQANRSAYYAALASGAVASFVALAALGAFAVVLHRHLRARLKASALLREQREWLNATLRSIGDGVIATDSDGRVTMLNNVAQALIGWKEEEARGQPLPAVFQIINEHTRQPVDDPALRALRQGTIVALANHTVLISRSRVERPIDDGAAPIRSADGQVIGAVLVFRDVTEQRRAETALKDAARRKDEFLAMLAHELRNPLACICSAVEILRRSDGRDSVSEEAHSILSRQLGQIKRLVEDLLDVSRISHGKLQVRKERMQVSAAVQSAVESVRPLVEARGHQLNLSLPNEAIYLDADPVRLAQIISNLLTNAAKYTDKGGRISLIVARHKDEIVLSVQDSGMGIAAENLDQIFEIFSQTSQARKRAEGGVGIGLALVRGLAALHGGTVEARSPGLGMGSEFIVRLPISKETVAAEAART